MSTSNSVSSSSVTNAIQNEDSEKTTPTNGTQPAKKKPKKLGKEAVNEIQRFLTRRLIGVTMTLENYKEALKNADPFVRAVTQPQVTYFEHYAATIKDLLNQSDKADKLLDPTINKYVEECLQAFQQSQNSSQVAASTQESPVGVTVATAAADEHRSKDGLTGTTQTSVPIKSGQSSKESGKPAKQAGK